MNGISCNGTFKSFSSAPNCRASGFTICVTLRQLWRSAPAFVLAQVGGAVLAVVVVRILYPSLGEVAAAVVVPHEEAAV